VTVVNRLNPILRRSPDFILGARRRGQNDVVAGPDRRVLMLSRSQSTAYQNSAPGTKPKGRGGRREKGVNINGFVLTVKYYSTTRGERFVRQCHNVYKQFTPLMSTDGVNSLFIIDLNELGSRALTGSVQFR